MNTPSSASPTSVPPPRATTLTTAQIAWIVAWTVIVAVAGGLTCGWLLTRFGMLGNLGFLLLGILAGIAGRQITERPVRGFGIALSVAMLVAFFLAHCYWLIYANFANPADNAATWSEAAQDVFTLPGRNPQRFLVSAVCLAMGIFSAYWRAGTRGQAIFVKDEA